MGVNIEGDRSVYIKEDIKNRQEYPINQASRELITKYSRTKIVLDIGCSDLVTSGKLLADGFTIYGMDLELSALQEAKQRHGSNARVFQGDVTSLPIQKDTRIDTVVMLEVLEHLPQEDASQVLQRLGSLHPDITLILSMPNISKTSAPYWMERAKVFANGGERPKTGLLDRTHQLLWDTDKQQAFFQEHGWNVVEAYSTNWTTGVTGEWETVKPMPYKSRTKGIIYRAATEILPGVIHPLNKDRRKQVGEKIGAYQGLYVLNRG